MNIAHGIGMGMADKQPNYLHQQKQHRINICMFIYEYEYEYELYVPQQDENRTVKSSKSNLVMIIKKVSYVLELVLCEAKWSLLFLIWPKC